MKIDRAVPAHDDLYCTGAVAFAGNSLLCRAALAHTRIDAASFATVRLLPGAVVLRCLVWLRGGARKGGGNWLSALALFAYAAGFSFSYVHLTAAAGAPLLFGAVQITMIGYGARSGDRMRSLQIVGLVLACGGLVGCCCTDCRRRRWRERCRCSAQVSRGAFTRCAVNAEATR